MKQYALRFISGKYQGGQFKLEVDREIIIGRATDADMVLVEDMVSRRHARIYTHDDKITILDGKSTNGTFINGERVTTTDKVELKEGDRILIGTSVLKLVAIEESTKVTSIPKEDPVQDYEPHRTTMSITRHMSGSIDEIPLPDLLQLLSTSRKSGILNITSNKLDGKIFLRDGKVYFCTINDSFDLDPTKAFFRCITWVTGSFDLLPPDETSFLNEIKESTEGLLMEGMRILDEINRIRKDIPSEKASFVITKPLMSSLKDLTAVQLEILQIIFNDEVISIVLDKSPYSDLDTYEILVALKEKNYITVKE
jgi:pSer/pThr/pTyr-binding forkhead associated (FHA) protein